MKSLAIFLLLNVLISIVRLNTTESFALTEAPCESKCIACQETAYNLKFHNQANCKNGHCKSTVI
jgi:hypothetical protein